MESSQKEIEGMCRIHFKSEHKKKLIGTLIIFLITIILSSTLPFMHKDTACNKIGENYLLCNRTLQSEYQTCYTYKNETDKLIEIYQACVLKTSQRCVRQISDKTVALTLLYDHIFFVMADDPLNFYAVVNRTCFLNANEVDNLFHFL